MSGYQLTKMYGQHLLTSQQVINNIVSAASVLPGDVVLEIGPGSGNLTVALLEKARQVIAIELDERMVSELKKRVPEELRRKLKIIHGDFTKVEIPPFDMCVSNCPYNVSSQIIFKLLSLAQQNPQIRKFVLMFQLEFAQSLVAEPGQEAYSRLSINTRLFTTTHRLLFKVDRNAFTPPPKVESAVILIEPLRYEQFSERELQQFEALTRTCFSTKNKMLRAIFNLRGVLNTFQRNQELVLKRNVDQKDIKNVLKSLLIEMQYDSKRPFQMSVDEFLTLLKALNEKNLFLG